MKNIQEVRVLTTLRLSETQKIVMSRVINAPNEYIAYENVNEGPNMVAALKELVHLGMMEAGDGTLTMTDSGMSVLQNENIVDESGQLTQDGMKYAEMKGPSEKGGDQEPPQPTETPEPGEMPQEEMPSDEELPPDENDDELFNSFNLIWRLEDDLLIERELKKLSRT